MITRRGQNLLDHVSELINPAIGDWDIPLVHQTFCPVDVQRILSIPLSSRIPDDFVAYNLTKSGTFSVKTAYHAEWSAQHGQKLRRTYDMGSSAPHPAGKIYGSSVFRQK